MIILSFLDIEPFIQLGLPGVAIFILAYLLVQSYKNYKELNNNLIKELNNKDEKYIAMQEKTVAALVASSEVLKNAVETIKEFHNPTIQGK